MLSYVFMKILEGRPPSYDRRINQASGGRVAAMKKAVVKEVPKGAHVLEVGCGTGELGAMLCADGCTVDGFDFSPAMVKEANRRIVDDKLAKCLSVREMGVDGMDGIEEGLYDAVVATLSLSELTDGERRFALQHAFRVLKPGGTLVVADEVLPKAAGQRWLHTVARAPLVAATFLASRSSTRPIADLAGEAVTAGFTVDKQDLSDQGAFCLLVAHRPKEEG